MNTNPHSSMEPNYTALKRGREDESNQGLDVEQEYQAKRRPSDELSNHAELAAVQVKQYVEIELPDFFTLEQREQLVNLSDTAVFHRASHKQIQHRNFVYTQVECKYSLSSFTFTYSCSSQSGLDHEVYDIVAQLTVEKASDETNLEAATPITLFYVNVSEDGENESAVVHEAELEAILADLQLHSYGADSTLFYVNYLLCFVEPNSVGYASSLHVADLLFGPGSATSESVSIPDNSESICEEPATHAEQPDEPVADVSVVVETAAEPLASSSLQDAPEYSDANANANANAAASEQAFEETFVENAEPDTVPTSEPEVAYVKDEQQDQQNGEETYQAVSEGQVEAAEDAGETVDEYAEEKGDEIAPEATETVEEQEQEQYETNDKAEDNPEATYEQQHMEGDYAGDASHPEETEIVEDQQDMNEEKVGNEDDLEEEEEPITQVYEVQEMGDCANPVDGGECDEELSGYGDESDMQETDDSAQNNIHNEHEHDNEDDDIDDEVADNDDEEYIEKGDYDLSYETHDVQIDSEVPDDSELH